MQCPRCFFENPADARWCGYCGADLGPAEPIADPGGAARKRETRLDGPAAVPDDDPFRPAATGIPTPTPSPARAPGVRGGAAAPTGEGPTPDPGPRRRRAHATLVEGSEPQRTGEVVGALLILGEAGDGRAVLLREGRLRIGREDHNDVVLADPRVSGDHLIVRAEGGRAWVLDTSTNGSLVAGARLKADRAEVTDGTIIEIGRTVLVVQLLAGETLNVLRSTTP